MIDANLKRPHRFGKLLRVIYAIPNASVILARNETRLAKNETRGGNLLLSGTVHVFDHWQMK